MKLYKQYIKIAPEGYKIILFSFFIWLITCSFLLLLNYLWTILIISCIMLTICFFFRDPNRKSSNNNNNNIFFSPVDGKILSIKKHTDEDLGETKKIAIFLSVFNVHRQWVPTDGIVLNTFYNPGKFFGAYKNKSSQKNEQSITLFLDKDQNKYKIKQIAGFIARRIVNHMTPEKKVKKGQKLGFIKFGSRVEIIVPNHFEINVKKGMKVRGCKTIIGQFK